MGTMPVGVQQGIARRVVITPIKNTFQKLQKRYSGHTGRTMRDAFVATATIAGTAIGIQAVKDGAWQGKRVSFDFLTRLLNSSNNKAFFYRVTSHRKKLQTWFGRLGEKPSLKNWKAKPTDANQNLVSRPQQSTQAAFIQVARSQVNNGKKTDSLFAHLKSWFGNLFKGDAGYQGLKTEQDAVEWIEILRGEK